MAIRKRGFYSPWGYEEENDYQSSENQFDAELNELFASASYNKDDKKIHFFNNDGLDLSGSSIDVSEFAAGSVIKEVSYDPVTKILTIEFEDGETIEINFAELVNVYDFTNGLQEEGNVVSVKLDSNGEAYLTVSEDGLKLSGVTEAINAEKERAEASEEALNERFDEIIEKLGYNDNDTLVTTNEHEVAFGHYNVSNEGTIFSVGIGTGDNDRKNAIEIRTDGSVLMWIEGDFMNINNLLAKIAHEVY